MKRLLLTATSLLALSGCMTVGPDYRSPAPHVQAQAQKPFVSNASSPLFTGNEPPGRWWSLFNDPALDGLVQQALTAASIPADYVQLEGQSVRARFASTDTQIKAKDAIAHALNPDAADAGYIVALP